MNYLRYSVGIDMAKKDFKACLSVIDVQQKVTVKASRTFINSLKGFKLFVTWAAKFRKLDLPICFTMEATGVYHEQLAWFLFQQQLPVSIILPTKAKRYLQSLGFRSKTDAIDARGLAQMGAEQNLPPWQPISKDLYILRSLTRHLESLQNTKTMLINQLEACQHGMFAVREVVKSLQATIKKMDHEILKIKQQIIHTLKTNDDLLAKTEKMISIKGVSWITAAVVIAETNGFALFENQRQLTSYAGYDVIEKQSGTKTGKSRISKKGNTHLRRAMHMVSLAIVTHQVNPFNNLFQRVYERTACKMKGYVAVQRKLLIMLYTLWKKDEFFDEQYGIESANQKQSLSILPAAARS